MAGSSLALFAVLTKGVVEVAEDGLGAVLRSPEFYPWVLVALCGMIFQQSAFRAGALTASLPTMTVAKPVVAGALGITVLGETLAARVPRRLSWSRRWLWSSSPRLRWPAARPPRWRPRWGAT